MSRFNVTPTRSQVAGRGSNSAVAGVSNDVYADRGYSGFGYDFRNTPEYQSALEQLRNANSPYLSELENLQGLYGDYGTSFGERLGMFFGSSLDSQRTDLRNAALANINAILQKENARVYNLPSNQASLERAAGLNTDLTGISGTAQVTDADNPVDNPSLSEMSTERASNELSIPSTFVNILSSAIGSVYQFAQAGIALKSATADIASKEIGSYSSAQDLVISQIANAVPVSDFEDPVKAVGSIIKAAKSVDLAPYSRSTRKFMRAYLSTLDESKLGPSSEIYKKLSELVTNKSSSARVIGSPDYDSDFATMLDKMAETTSKYVFSMTENEAKLKELAVTIREYESQVAGRTVDDRVELVQGQANIADAQGYVAQQTKIPEAEYKKAVYEYQRLVSENAKASREGINSLIHSIDDSNLPAWMKASLKWSLITGESTLQSVLQSFSSGSGFGLANRLFSRGAGNGVQPFYGVNSFTSDSTY